MMAATYVPIQSVTLASSAASVSFTGIPQTFTDLVVRWSSRADTDTAASGMEILINSTTAGYSSTAIRVRNGTTAESTRTSSASSLTDFYNEPSNYTANTFSSGELYIPAYVVAQNKPLSISNVLENNAAATNYAPMGYAGLWSNTAAITTILLRSAVGNLAAGSTFHLYGIKNS